jgi:DNA repair protein RecN (Recombination protein N)
MLETLYVKDFALIDTAEIAFDRGLTVVTGETGAGKSLLVDALMLLAGARADPSLVRIGCERAELIAEFSLVDRVSAQNWLTAEAFDEGGACQLRRVIRSEGSSRAWINGRPATLAQLAALAEHLFEIHGQHEHQALLDRAHQLALLDAFGGHSALRTRVSELARRWRTLDAERRTIADSAHHAERLALLEHEVDELERHALAAPELEALYDTHKRMANAGRLLEASSAIAEALDGDGEFAVLRTLARIRGELARLVTLDPSLDPVRELLEAATIQLAEANDRIVRHRDTLDLDPQHLAEIEAQIAKLHELSRKHRVPTAALRAHGARLREELSALRSAGERLDALHDAIAKITEEYAHEATQLRVARRTAATRLAQAVTALMGELGMRGGRFEVALEETVATDPDPQGCERAEFLVSANPGQPPRPLRKVASGGELSRISLAIEVAALGLDDVGCMVFDEVDSGIGGAVAEVVGQKLRRLGEARQVLCVTHLPQVAVQGHRHLRVSKTSDGGHTDIRIESLTDAARRDEIARMLGGLEITRETLAHAQQMLERAAAAG